MRSNNTISTKKIVMTGLMAALVFVGSYLRIRVPADITGTSSFHLGNIFCALSGILLGPWFGGLAAGLGSALFDIVDPVYISECWITFLTKGMYGLMAGLAAGKTWGYGRAVLASLSGAVTYAVLYLAKNYFYNGLLLHSLTAEAAMLAVVSKLPATIFNALVAIVFAPILAVAIRRALAQNNIRLD